MNHCVVQQNALAACDEIRGPVADPDRKGSVVCPRPRRLGVLPADHTARPLRWHLPYQPDGNDLEILLSKERPFSFLLLLSILDVVFYADISVFLKS